VGFVDCKWEEGEGVGFESLDGGPFACLRAAFRVYFFFLSCFGCWVFEKSFTFVRLFVSKPAFEQEHELVVAPIPTHGIAGVACTFLVFVRLLVSILQRSA
jgi:hypothetical protein